MRYIKTYWHQLDNPYKESYNIQLQREPLYQFALSSLLLIKYHPVELYTDIKGAEIVEQLQIPFAKINVLHAPSLKYRSVNDLYALSLQSKPTTLVGDDILTMGPLNISESELNDGLIVYGMDLNSTKVVKSLIKMRRITHDIPLMDDFWWSNSKDGYIDTAFLSTGNQKVLKEYLEEAVTFIQEYSDKLAKIETSIVENFLMRYWLYSYFRSKEVQIQMFIDGPEANASAENFGFSHKNILNHILKINEYNFHSIEFSLHFFHFFQIKYPDTFDLISKFYFTNNHCTDQKQMLRTRQVLKRADIFVNDEEPITNRLIKEISKKTAKNNRCALLEDCFKYEKYLHDISYEIHQQWETVYEQTQKAFVKLLENWGSRSIEFSALILVFNANVFLFESKWKWCTHWIDGVSRIKIAELKVIYNSANEPSYFISAFVPYWNREIYEFSIDKLSATIIQHFTENSTIDTFFRELSHNDSGSMKDLYYMRIQELLKFNILCIV